MKPLTLSTADRAHILDAIEDALVELEDEQVAELVSQRLVDKLLSSREILRGR